MARIAKIFKEEIKKQKREMEALASIFIRISGNILVDNVQRHTSNHYTFTRAIAEAMI